ncbi:MAG: HAD family hydrolase [Bacteroidetes bacterium]|mgnify:CR=1 FL=1|nr:MAG: HAD family hydrolase [Bacteroidota bacterium]REK33732.1 MAG: HAD family hydrolase [Bacteroidota bacterium]REK49202.1 MAG: HAD family hydrolase [Bacteroidota bacterium]
MARYAPYKALLIDLDNTIYDENLYLFAAYSKIAEYLGGSNEKLRMKIDNFLKETFRKEGRRNLFDKLFDEFDIDSSEMQKMLEIMRNVKVESGFEIFPGVRAILNRFTGDGKIVCVITNGNPVQQRNKVAHVNWNGLAEKMEFIYADEIAKKPSPEAALMFFKKHGLKGSEVLMIGDSREDEQCARAAGMDFIHAEDLI